MTIDDVCFVSTWDVSCGIAKYTAALRGALDDSGVATSVLTIDRQQLGRLARRELASYFDDLGREAAGHRVVHVQHEFGFFAGSYGHPESVANLRRFLKAARRGAERVVVTFHSLPPVPFWPHRTLAGVAREQFLAQVWRVAVAKLLRGDGVRVVAPSRYQRRLLIDSGVDPSVISLISQGAPTFSHRRTRAGARAALGIDEEAKVVVLFGFVAAHKGHLVAINALRALPASYHLVVVGGPHPHNNDPTYEKVLSALRRRPALRPRVHVTGWVEDDEVADWFAASDVAIAPYIDSRLVTSAAAVWALASGRPLIASDLPVFRELVDDWDCAELVAPDAPNRLAETIQRIVDDDERSKELVENAAEAATAWAWPRVAEEHVQIYR
ncbi:MAG TPA: glycosyltransferase [Acidimicrobiales bacterium]